jgi:outer membrane protein W
LYPFKGALQPFLLVGVGLTHAEFDDKLGLGLSVEDEAFAARFGVGVDIYITERVLMNIDADYVMPTGNVEDFDYVGVRWGFQYRF